MRVRRHPLVRHRGLIVVGLMAAAVGSLACRTTHQGQASQGGAATATRDARQPAYLSDQAAGMAAEDAARVNPTATRPSVSRRPSPIRVRPRSPVDQPRIR